MNREKYLNRPSAREDPEMTKTRSVRLSEDLSKPDAWIAAQPEPRPSRSEATRRILSQALGKTADAKSPALRQASDAFLRALGHG